MSFFDDFLAYKKNYQKDIVDGYFCSEQFNEIIHEIIEQEKTPVELHVLKIAEFFL